MWSFWAVFCVASRIDICFVRRVGVLCCIFVLKTCLQFDSELTTNTQIIMALTQTILYNLQLPEFINKFKQACISTLLPPIDYAIQFLKTTNSSILIVLLIVLFVQLIRVAITEVRNSKKIQTVSQQTDNRAAAREIKDLKRQLKAMQKTVQELKENGMSKSSISQRRQSTISNQATKQIIISCKESWAKREEIALHLIEYQTMLMQEVRELKRSNSRISSPLKSYNNIVVSGPLSNKNTKIPANLPSFNSYRKDQVSQTKNSEMIDKVQPRELVTKVRKVEVPTKRKEPEASTRIIEQHSQHTQQIPAVEHQLIKQRYPTATQVIQNSILQNPSQNKEINHTSMPIQQIEYKQQIVIPSNNTQITQDLKIEQSPLIVEETPRPMPPLPKQTPSVGRRPPGPPQKGDRKNPPPPPMRKM